MNLKAKGSNAERDLIHKFNAAGWVAIRAAGSGSQKYAAPDILAGNNIRRVAIECKTTADLKKYLTKKEVEELIFFSQKFGAEAWIAIKFDRMDWFFFNIEDLEKTENSYVIDIPTAKRKGLSFEQVIGVSN
ncbi:MAG TPA: Holliday junction resolvase Hjc [Alphaproteobacteria bacterium]|nr:Holliday junction resolvase Hjc [Alphaproteobacteria bacterium]